MAAKTPAFPADWGPYEKWSWAEWKDTVAVCLCGYELKQVHPFYRAQFCNWCEPPPAKRRRDKLIMDPEDLDRRTDPPRFRYLRGVRRHSDAPRPPKYGKVTRE